MSELKQFKLPDVGEGLTEAEILRWYVALGDKVTVNQIIVEIETAKAAVELPSPFEGVVASLLVPEGATVDVGTPIIAVEVGRRRGRGRGAPRSPPPRASTAARTWSPPPPAEGAASPACMAAPAPKEPGTPGGARRLRRESGTTVRRPRKPASATARRTPPLPPASAAAPAAPPGLPTPTSASGGRATTRRSAVQRSSRCWPSRRCASWPRTSASTCPADRDRPGRVHHPRGRAVGRRGEDAAGPPPPVGRRRRSSRRRPRPRSRR